MKKLPVICVVTVIGWVTATDVNTYPTYHIEKDQSLYGNLKQGIILAIGRRLWHHCSFAGQHWCRPCHLTTQEKNLINVGV